MAEWTHAKGARRWSWLAASLMLAAIVVGIVAADPPAAKKQPAGSTTNAKQPDKAATAKPANPAAAQKAQSPAGASTSEPIVARVNNEIITYKQLAEECIARKGPEVLDTMISKMLVMQACRAKGIKVTAQEIDEEIGRTAQKLKLTPEAFLKMLKDQREIDPKRYREDIVMPGLLLKKLASPLVKVTEEDIERGFEAQYGEKIKCRWIMVDNQTTASKAWNELRDSSKENDGKVELAEFERQVTKYSMDINSRASGGQIQPISRHTSPAYQTLERAAFNLKEDGEISPVVQFGTSFVILYRERHMPPINCKLEDVRSMIEADIYDAKLRDQIAMMFQDLKESATIENLLTGDVSVPEKGVTQAGKTEKANKEPAKVGSAKDSPKKTSPTMKR